MPAVKSAALCQGQHHHFLRYHQVPRQSRYEAHITLSYPLPGGCTVAGARAALNYLVRRHEVLRTVYDLCTGPGPRQVVMAPGPLPVREVAADGPAGPAAAAAAVRELVQRPFDLAEEWPLRACLVTRGGELSRMQLVFNHLAFDDVSLNLLSRDLDALLAAGTAGPPARLPAVAQQPIDLADYEAERPAGEVTAALRHWQAEIARMPADICAARRRPAATSTDLTSTDLTSTDVAGIAHSASLTVPALLSAARSVSARERVWPSAVHLAAFAVTLAAYTGERTAACGLYTSQRDAGDFRSVLTCMSYPTAVVADLSDDPPFSEVVARMAARVQQSMENGHVPHDAVLEMIAQEGTRRGLALRPSPELNFLNRAPKSCGTRRERFVWNAVPTDWATVGEDLYFRVYEWTDGITLVLQAMDDVMDRDMVSLFLHGYARLLEAHRDGTADLRVSQAADLIGFPPPAGGLLRIGSDAVDPEETARMLCGHPAVQSAKVEGTGRGLRASVRASRPVTAGELRGYALGAAPDHVAARCPDWFVITGPGGEVTEGADGPAAAAPAGAAEEALAAAVAAANESAQPDLTLSYVLAGGRVLCLPRVLDLLRGQGWDGAGLQDLLGIRPLRAVAARMRRTGGQ
jgi:hypothetical protein